MATWADLQKYVRGRYQLKNDSDEGFSVLVEFANGRTQLIGAHHFKVEEKSFIELRSYVCKENEMSLKVALKKNDGFAIGALALDEEGDYCLLYSTLLGALSPQDFDVVLALIARTADKLEAAYAASDEH